MKKKKKKRLAAALLLINKKGSACGLIEMNSTKKNGGIDVNQEKTAAAQ